jgi:TrmH family RNA methyltransferase
MAFQFIDITSNANKVVKDILKLSDKKGRSQMKAYILEGLRLVEEAKVNGGEILYYVFAESFTDRFAGFFDNIQETGIYRFSDDLFKRVSQTESPQGIMAVARIPEYDPAAVIQSIKRCVILENLQDPGNLGTIIRTADACGFDGVVISKGSVDPYNPKVLRSTMGSMFHIPVMVSSNLPEVLVMLKDRGIRIATAHPRASQTIWDAPLGDKVAIVIGNEGNGLSDEMLQASDIQVTIPMPGKAESFNASVAAGMLLYESMRQCMASQGSNR